MGKAANPPAMVLAKILLATPSFGVQLRANALHTARQPVKPTAPRPDYRDRLWCLPGRDSARSHLAPFGEAYMSDLGVQPAAAVTPGLSQLQRITNTFSAPSKTFLDIKNGHRSWWLPFIIYVILGFCFYGVVNSKVGMRQVSENQVKLSPKAEEQMAQLTPEQREQRMNISTKITEGLFLGSPVFLLIMGVVIAAVLLGTINFGFGGRASFGSIFAVWMYAMLPSCIKTLLGIVVLYAGTAPESFNIKNFAPTNIGAFMNPLDMNAGLYSLLSSIDIITIWTLVLVGIGTAMVAGVKRSSGYIAAFGWWAVVVLVGAGVAAAFS